jgi:hypothetical protein
MMLGQETEETSVSMRISIRRFRWSFQLHLGGVKLVYRSSSGEEALLVCFDSI